MAEDDGPWAPVPVVPRHERLSWRGIVLRGSVTASVAVSHFGGEGDAFVRGAVEVLWHGAIDRCGDGVEVGPLGMEAGMDDDNVIVRHHRLRANQSMCCAASAALWWRHSAGTLWRDEALANFSKFRS
jgi:hypothetical protein